MDLCTALINFGARSARRDAEFGGRNLKPLPDRRKPAGGKDHPSHLDRILHPDPVRNAGRQGFQLVRLEYPSDRHDVGGPHEPMKVQVGSRGRADQTVFHEARIECAGRPTLSHQHQPDAVLADIVDLPQEDLDLAAICLGPPDYPVLGPGRGEIHQQCGKNNPHHQVQMATHRIPFPCFRLHEQ